MHLRRNKRDEKNTRHICHMCDVNMIFDMATIVRIKYVEDPPRGNDNGTPEAIAAERETLVNINCPIRMVLDYIRKIARLSDTCEFDLCEEVNCQLRNVSFYGSNTRAMDVLQANLTYFIITFQRDEIGQMINLIPLLTAKAAKRCCDVIMAKTRRPVRKASSVESTLNNANKSNE